MTLLGLTNPKCHRSVDLCANAIAFIKYTYVVLKVPCMFLKQEI